MIPDTGLRREARGFLLALLVIGAGVLLSFWRLHVDNNDAALYTVIARYLVTERTPFALHYPAADFASPPFYDHPPLFFWVQAATLAVVPSFDLRLLGALCGILTVGFAFALGRDLLGPRIAFLGCILLVATETFSNYQPLARLDPPLTFAFTASIAVLVLAQGRPGLLFLGGLIAGIGALVKGPPAFAAPVAALLLVVARGDGALLRRPVSWLMPALGTIAPPLAFLVYDHLALAGAWWNGYVIGQVVGSAMGGRRGTAGPLTLLQVNLWRFWPGLPFVGVALARACLVRWLPLEPPRVSVRMRLALLTSALLVYAGFATSGRRFWWYLMPAYVPMALLAGAGLEDLIPRLKAERVVIWARRVVLVCGATLLVLLPFGKVLGAFERPCLFGELPDKARLLAKSGHSVAVVSPTRDYNTHVIFAEHCRCDAVLVSRLADAERPEVAAALVPLSDDVIAKWRRVAVHGKWMLMQRVQE